MRYALRALGVVVTIACAGACGTPSDPAGPTPVSTAPVTVVRTHADQMATLGVPFAFDATAGGLAFSDPRRTGLTYRIQFDPEPCGLVAAGGLISGLPDVSGTVRVTVTATDATGQSASTAFSILIADPAARLPLLPASLHAYSDARVPLPAHFLQGPGGGVATADNTPPDNAITDAGATLGRVLFYDTRLSANRAVSCASCHRQQFGFSDTAKLSVGFAGALTGRHSMALANARFYAPRRFFWDERAATLEAQVLMPIQDAGEMGLTLPALLTRLSSTSFYPALFTAAFGTSEVTADRVSRALAQFVRSLRSEKSKFDQAFPPNGGPPNFPATFTALELQGQQLFDGAAGCARCHTTNAHVAPAAINSGLDAPIADVGAGQGRFKAPSLRNIAVRAPYMHDGRFRTLDEVVEFYNSGVRDNPFLDQRLRGPGGQPLRLNLSAQQKAALVAFLGTFTDQQFLTDPRFSDPFR